MKSLQLFTPDTDSNLQVKLHNGTCQRVMDQKRQATLNNDESLVSNHQEICRKALWLTLPEDTLLT